MGDISLSSLKSFFDAGHTRPYAFRLHMLDRLAERLSEFEARIVEALKADLGKSEAEAFTSEIAVVRHELEFSRRNLKRWMKPRGAPTPLHLQPGRSRIYSEPRGLVLIIAPWNYPVQLALSPLIGAVAAGNCVVVKPSELAPRTSTVIAEMLHGLDGIQVIEGGIEPTTRLLESRFDYIFFTGSTAVGRIVYQAAARNLTPVTLELGGKSPAVVAKDADLRLAARRIVWGKFLNAGQTCVAPDYVYVEESVAAKFLQEMKLEIQRQLGANPRESGDYGRIINAKNFERLEKLMAGGNFACGGERDRDALYIAPTVLTEVGWADPIMGEEIFGPLLPVLTFRHLQEAFAEIRKREKPLAAYLFSAAGSAEKEFLDLSFGGGCINDTVLHLVNPHLPFGGVGASGVGAYHGFNSFLTFSHQKPVLHKARFFDPWLRYPPFTGAKLGWLKLLLRLSR